MNNIPNIKIQDFGKSVLYLNNKFKQSDLTYKIISGHHYNNTLNILIPNYSSNQPVSWNHNKNDLQTIDNEAKNYIQNIDPCIPIYQTKYYEIYGQLSLIFDEQFLLNYIIPSSTIHIFSKNTDLRSDNCFCYLPEGVLYMSIDKQTYHTLGLQGFHSIFKILSNQRYIIKILLKEYYNKHQCFSPYIKKIYNCFQRIPEMTFIFYCEELDTIQFPSSYHIQQYQCQSISKEIDHVYLPSFNIETFQLKNNKEELLSTLSNFIEWIGIAIYPILPVLTNDINTSQNSSFTLPTGFKYINESSLSSIYYTGYFSSSWILQTINNLLKYIQQYNIPWCVVSVNGEINTPCCWVFPKEKFSEHQYLYNGDNNYILILFNNGNCILILDTGDMDQYI